jgi:predicted enzyme related to lactoylglutathione lyase
VIAVNPVTAIMIHVSDVPAALTWYLAAFPDARRKTIATSDLEFECLEIHGVQIELVPADAKVSAGASGSVVYWRVTDFDLALAHLQSVGAALYRGPGTIENGLRMCQVRDPWGNCIGLRG